MIYLKQFLYLCVAFCYFFGISQANIPCESWNKQKDFIENNDTLIRFNTSFLNKVDQKCKIAIYNSIAKTYRSMMQIDSSLHYYKRSVNLANKINARSQASDVYSSIAELYISIHNLDTAKVFLKKSKQLLDKTKMDEHVLNYYSVYGAYMSSKYEIAKAIAYSDSAIQVAVKLKDTINLPNLYQNIGVEYYNSNQTNKAIESLLKAVRLKEKYSHIDIDGTYYLLGSCYLFLEDYNTSNRYLKKALIAGEKSGNNYILMITHLELTKGYSYKEDYNTAIKYADSAKALAFKLDVKDYIAIAELNLEIGKIYFEGFKDFEKARKYIEEAHLNTLQIEDINLMYKTLEALFELELKTKNYKLAKRHLNQLEVITSKLNDIVITQKFHKILGRYYKATGNHEKALNNYLISFRIHDSIYNINQRAKISELEKQYDTQKKELKISQLNEEKNAQELLTQKAKNKQNLFLVFAVLLGTTLFIGFWVYKQLKQQRNKLAIAHNKLSEINRVKNRLFSIIAHDLKGMLVPFQRAGKVLNHHVEKENYEKVKLLSNDLQANSRGLSSMLDNLLNWSLEQMNGYTFKNEAFSVKNELETLLSNFKPHAKDKAIKMALHYEKDHVIMFDKGGFHVMFRNLLSNALKYTKNGTVNISFKRVDNTLHCSVEDTGVGIDANIKDKLFQLEKNHSTLGTEGEKGTGLGLNLVYRFVKMHKGDIKATSKLRIGTRFDLIFPEIEFLEDNKTLLA